MPKKLMLLILFCLLPLQSWSAAICVTAKWKGTVLDYEFLHGDEQPFQLQEKAEVLLAEKGYADYGPNVDIRHAQGQTYLKHGYAIVIEARYIPGKRKSQTERHSIGCGFSAKSFDDALWAAFRDMQTFDWGWKPDRDGYEVVKKLRF
ncbi:MAG: hypothetical protein PVG66_06845 [Chromatiales bacterium]|jgi:hypothetical protein